VKYDNDDSENDSLSLNESCPPSKRKQDSVVGCGIVRAAIDRTDVSNHFDNASASSFATVQFPSADADVRVDEETLESLGFADPLEW